MAINLVTRYSNKVLDQLSVTSVTAVPFNTNYDAEFIGANAVKIFTNDIPPLNDYSTAGATNRYGTPADLGDTVQTHTMTQKKSTTFIIDKTNNTDQLMIKNASKAIADWFLHQLMPFKDKYTLAKMVAATTPLEWDEAEAESLYYKILDADEKLDEAKAPQGGRIIWATPEAIKILKKDENFIGNNDLAQEQVKFRGQVGEVDGKPIIKAIKAHMPEDTMVILAHPSAVISPLKIEEATIHANPPGLSGHLGEALVYFDSFVLEGREGLIASVKNVTA